MSVTRRSFFMVFALRVSLLAIFLTAVAVPAVAQTFYGTVLGTVTDATGNVVPDAATVLINQGTQERRTALTGSSGNYRFVNLIPGNYRLEIEKTGFKRVVRPDIVVQVQSDVRIDVALEVGDLVQTIEVKDQTPLLQTDNAGLGHVISKAEEMPLNGRNVFGLLTLVPGVIAQGAAGTNPTGSNNTGWGNFQISGGMANANAWFMDGAPINVNYLSMTALVPTQDSLQEFKVQTSDPSAEWGRFWVASSI